MPKKKAKKSPQKNVKATAHVPFVSNAKRKPTTTTIIVAIIVSLTMNNITTTPRINRKRIE
jgi:hypothetical protein